MFADDLDELEQRVGEKWAAAGAARIGPIELGEWGALFDMYDGDVQPLSPDVPQFPREQWASYPAKRTFVLLACEAMLDRAGPLTDEQWTTLCMAMQYGGKTRIA